MKFYFCVNSRAYFTNIFFTQEILYMNKEKKIPGHILSLFIILLSISGICLLMYKAQFRFNLHQPIEYVMMTTHKPTGTITYHNLVLGFPILTETFTCTVPELKMFTIIYRAFKNVIFLLLLPVLNLDGVSRSQKTAAKYGKP